MKQWIHSLLLLVACQAVRGGNPGELSPDGTVTKVDHLAFSNTQKWNPDFLKLTRTPPEYLPADWLGKIRIPDPPANSSERTQAELKHLHSIRDLRPARRADVERELVSDGFRFGRHEYRDFLKGGKYPATQKLYGAMDHDLGIVIFTLKKRFDRVRPTFLDRDIGHLFPVPGHPAYPSGHSTQAFSIAFVLQELDPERAETYQADAQRIAVNREIAGFHYPSDTEAGKTAARQFVDLLLANAEFRRLLETAKEEW